MTNGIVLQLQTEALDENIEIETLLRKAYLVARKLHLKEFENWISSEQNGYKGNVPEYRIIGVEIKAWNPFHGWIPVVFEGELADTFSRMPLSLPISAISDAYNSSDGTIAFTVPGGLTDLLNKNMASIPTNYAFRSSKPELRKIISAVRNKILEWSILLEENGIYGTGLSFSDSEIKKAQESQVINNYINNFYSSSENTQIQQGGDSNQQS